MDSNSEWQGREQRQSFDYVINNVSANDRALLSTRKGRAGVEQSNYLACK